MNSEDGVPLTPQNRHAVLVEEANEAIQAARPVAIRSEYKLAYHITPPANWMNDPNGLIHWGGEYHVFYQHHPYRPLWGPMHWGHVKSKDLVHWEHLPIALAPSEAYETGGCYSGSAVDDDGIFTLIYTGNIWIDRGKNQYKQVQCVATSRDGVTFTKDSHNPVIKAAPREGSGDFRDPKVWKHGENWYMVLGTRKGDTGKVVLYRSPDLREWTEVGIVAESDGTLGYMWECPDLFRMDDCDVLIMSPEGIELGDGHPSRQRTGYLTGKFDYDTGVLKHGGFRVMDEGFDFYAAQTFLDDKGRRIVFGWMDMWKSNMPSREQGWAGALTIPRELSLTEDGRLRMNPVAELEYLRQRHWHLPAQVLQPGEESVMADGGILGDRLELCAVFSLQSCHTSEFGLKVRCSEDGTEETRIGFRVSDASVIFDRTRSGEGVTGVREVAWEPSGTENVTLRVFVDRSSVEVFVGDGELVMSNRIYPNKESLQVKWFAIGGEVRLVSFDTWELEDIWNPTIH